MDVQGEPGDVAEEEMPADGHAESDWEIEPEREISAERVAEVYCLRVLGARGVIGEEAVEGSGGWVGKSLLRHCCRTWSTPAMRLEIIRFV